MVEKNNEEMKKWIVQKQYGKINEHAKVVMREKEEGWTKPIKWVPIARFYKKYNKTMKNKRIEIDTMGYMKIMKSKTQNMKRN